MALKTDPQAFEETYEKSAARPDDKWQEGLKLANEGKTSWMVFARLNGKLIGMAGGYRDEGDLKDHTVQIWGVYVDPQERGIGVAKSLITALLEKFKGDPDIERVKLEVNTDQEPAKKLYESFGFKVSDTKIMTLGDAETHQISTMVKSLLSTN